MNRAADVLMMLDRLSISCYDDVAFKRQALQARLDPSSVASIATISTIIATVITMVIRVIAFSSIASTAIRFAATAAAFVMRAARFNEPCALLAVNERLHRWANARAWLLLLRSYHLWLLLLHLPGRHYDRHSNAHRSVLLHPSRHDLLLSLILVHHTHLAHRAVVVHLLRVGLLLHHHSLLLLGRLLLLRIDRNTKVYLVLHDGAKACGHHHGRLHDKLRGRLQDLNR